MEKKEVAKLSGCEVEIKDGEKTAKGKVVLTEKILGMLNSMEMKADKFCFKR